MFLTGLISYFLVLVLVPSLALSVAPEAFAMFKMCGGLLNEQSPFVAKHLEDVLKLMPN